MAVFVSRLWWTLPLFGQVIGSPDHDEIQAQVETITAPQSYLAADDRRLSGGSPTCPQIMTSGTLGSLRIGYELIDVGNVPVDKQNLVKDLVMKKAAEYWGSALRVRRASAPLRIPRFCSSTYGETCSTMTAATCGADVTVPDAYLGELEVCGQFCNPGVQCSMSSSCYDGASNQCTCDGDAWKAQGSSYCCTMTADNTCPANCDPANAVFNSGGAYCKGSCTTHAQGAGAVNEDMHVFVTIKDKTKCAAGGDAEGSLASASWCAKDQCDRPIFASINFCPQSLSLLAADLDKQVSTAVHELGHALGFSSSLFKYFRNSDGTPKIARNSANQDTFATEKTWYCVANTNAGIQFDVQGSGQGYLQFVDLSPPSIIQVFNERGFDSCACPVGKSTMENGCVVRSADATPTCVMRMVMPTVRTEARNFFNCQTLEGAEMENQPTSDCSIFASHWEQRVFNGEVMASTSSEQVPIYMSRVTLALFQDSGWYEVDFSMADTLTVGVHWGYKQGCDFAKNKCVDGGTPVNPMFCAASGLRTCSLDRTSAKTCTLSVYTALASQFTYGIPMNNGNVVGGSMSVMDYCPSFQTGISQRVCTDTSSVTLPFNNFNFMHEFVGQESRCFMSTLRGAVDGTTAPSTNFADAVPTCYEVECASDGLSYKLKIADTSTDSESNDPSHSTKATVLFGTCTSEGQTLSSGSFEGSVTCASPAVICQIVQPAKHTQGGSPSPSTTPSADTTPSSDTSTGGAGQTSGTTSMAGGTTATTTGGTGGTGATTMQAGTTQAATTTAAGGVVTGSFTLSLTNTTAFLADATAMYAVKSGLATFLDVPVAWIHLEFGSRRLEFVEDENEDDARRLADISVTYTVTVPPGSSTSATAVASKANTATLAELTAAVSTAVEAATPNSNYGVAVSQKSTVAIDGTPVTLEETTSSAEGIVASAAVTASLSLFSILWHKEFFA